MHAGYLLVRFRQKRNWSQADLRDAIGLGRGVMSDLENGKRVLSGHYLKRIEEAYIFDETELRMLREQAAVDRVQAEYRIDFSERLKGPFESLEDMLNNLRTLRRRDGLTGAGSLIPSQIGLLRRDRDRYPTDRPKIERLEGKALVERLDGFRQTLTEREIESRSQNELGLLKLRLKALEDDPEDHELARLLPVTILYVAGQLEDDERLKQLVGQLSEPYPIMVCARALVAINAILYKRGKWGLNDAIYQFEKAEDIAHKVLADKGLSTGEKVSIYEALSFGHAVLGLRKGSYYLGLAKNLQLQAGDTRLAVMDGLIIRTEINNLVLNTDADVQTILDVAEEGARIAKERGYKRQRSQIIDCLLNHPDGQVKKLGWYLRNTS